ncbi:MAG: hypothetical protein IJE08_06710 [Clostridia bacterium]|nr:hypothetical protein [Clostridia bacterium]
MNRQNVTSKRRNRSRFRAKLIRTGVICTVTSLIVGIGVGIFCGKILWNDPNTGSVSSIATHQPIVTTAPTATPAPIAPFAVNADGTTLGTNDNPFSSSSSYDFFLQVSGHEEPVEFSVSIANYLSPEFYETNYGDAYKLMGTEAAAVISITASAPVDVNDYLTFSLETANGEVIEGYPLMDAAISGEYSSQLSANQPTTLYKRFQYDAAKEAKYLTLLHPYNGQTVKAYFFLEYVPDPTTAPTFPVASATPTVTPTAAPTPSGIADAVFQQYLYANHAQ